MVTPIAVVNRVIKFRVGGQAPRYMVRSARSFSFLHEHAYMESEFYHQLNALIEIEYPDYCCVPNALLALAKTTFNIPYEDDRTLRVFDTAWHYLQIYKKGATETVDTPFVSRKAIMLFEKGADPNGYDRDVFVWNSVDGVKRINFTQYLHEVEAKHDGTYKLVKIQESNLSELDQTHFDVIAHLATPMHGDKRGTIYMCFRALWYAATKELMPAMC